MSPEPSAGVSLWPLAVAGVLVVALQGLFLALDMPPVLGPYRDLVDPDSYMRLLRVERLWQTGAWYDSTSPWTNAPFGDVMHWTRPLDVILVAGAWPLSLVMEARDAIFWAGVFVGPVLQLLSVVVLYWGTRHLLSVPAYLLLTTLFSVQLFGRYAFLPARPDHHGLQLFLFVVAVSLALNLAVEPARRRLAVALGVTAGVGLWVSPEALAPTAWICLVLGLVYLSRDEAWQQWQDRISDFLIAATGTLVVALVLERGWADLLAVEYDRLSIAHLCLLGAMAAAWAATVRVHPSGGSRASRLRIGIVATVAVAAFMAFAFPEFFGGPFVDAHPRMTAMWIAPVNELRPLVGRGASRMASLVFSLGPMLVALPFTLVAFGRRRPPGRPAWLVLMTGMMVFTPLALFDVRMAQYLELPIVIGWCAAIQAAAGWTARNVGPTRALRPARVPLFLALLCTPGLMAGVLLWTGEPGPARPPGCAWGAVAPVLRELEAADGDAPILFTLPQQGPEIVYRTGHRVVGAPYHRNTRAMIDSQDVVRAEDFALAREILTARGVDHVVLCRSAPETRRYLRRRDDVFLARLLAGEYPDWLTPRPLPEGLDEQFVLLTVEP